MLTIAMSRVAPSSSRPATAACATKKDARRLISWLTFPGLLVHAQRRRQRVDAGGLDDDVGGAAEQA
jgi:hypothetical protein